MRRIACYSSKAALSAAQVFASRLLQLLQPRFGLGRIRLHLFDGGIDIGVFRGCDFGGFVMVPFASLAPGLLLRSGDVPECGLLLVDLLVDSLEIGFDIRFKAVPFGLELLLISGCLCLDLGLKLIAPLL